MEHRQSSNTFHRATGFVFLFGQMFSIFPISGILCKTSHQLHFRWFSIRTIYYLVLTIFQIISFSLSIRRVVRTGKSFSAFASVFFYFVTLTGSFFIFRLARRWKSVIGRIEKIEKIFLYPPYRQVGWTMRWKVRLIAFILLFGAIIEHLFYFGAKFLNAKIQLERCNINIPMFEHYLRTERRHLYPTIPFTNIIATLFEWANISSTICWSYLDVLVTVFSVNMAYRFKQLSDRMKRVRFKTVPDTFWIEIRSHFTDLTNLLNYLDNELSNIIILSCGSNLYFICQQLFNSFSVTPEQLNAVYFWYSLIYIIIRALTMLFFAASINEAAKEPYQMLKSLPYTSWTCEIQRFSDQLISEVIGFSGKRFFYITRTLILALIGTIVTYELVLLDHVVEAPELIQKSCHITYIETIESNISTTSTT
uniref:Gustatory receptor n=1 Tax=Lutzomyia longipalpis TaxID=7200 RepID=A0A1B0CHD5_LUTLO